MITIPSTLAPVDAARLRAYRQLIRSIAPPPADGRVDPTDPTAASASPVYPFVLASAALDQALADLAPVPANPAVPVSRIHLSQEFRLHRLIQADERINVDAAVVGSRLEPRGVRLALRTVITAELGQPIAELMTGAMLVGARGPLLSGGLPSYPAQPPADPAASALTVTTRVPASALAAYAELAGDDNPIHLDDGAARAAGLPGVICHGMSVLAVVVEEIVDRYAEGDPRRVSSVGCRFSAAVRPDEPITTDLRPALSGGVITFVCRAGQAIALKNGWVAVRGRDDA